MKLFGKAMAVAVSMVVCVVLVLSQVYTPSVQQHSGARIKICVVDLDGNPVHNAKVKVVGCNLVFNTDNNGLSPSIDLPKLTNVYDAKIDQWYTVNLHVQKSGYVDTFVLNCVVYLQQNRNLTVKIYPTDDSHLPYVCYVESPPSEYLESLMSQN